MSKRRNNGRKRRDRKNKKEKNITPLCIIIAVCLAFGGMICAGASGGGTGATVGIIVFLSSSVVLSIPAAMSARKDAKRKKYDHKVSELIFHGHLTRITDKDPYSKKISWGVLREGMINSATLFLVFAAAFGFNLYMSDNASSTRAVDRAMFTLIILAVITLPCITYSISHSATRFMRAVRGEYLLCSGVILTANGLAHSMSIEADDNKIYEFDYCRGIGTTAKSLEGQTAVIAFFNDEIYVMRTNVLDKGSS